MKKLFLILLAVLCCAGLSAQKAKFGHVDYASIMPLMPGIDTAKTALAALQDVLEEEGALMSQELKQKEADYMKLVNSGASAAMLKVKEDEFNKLYERFQTFVTDGERRLQEKQLELLKPFQENIMAAIKKVAEAEHYTYVFDISTLAFYGESTDLTAAVKKELGIQ
ncbi:MAG: OmpH family outer membrane protein [Bacteroidales bacterium]|nr:OmpH family outer membrane protein [Bacteroidales bacterium]